MTLSVNTRRISGVVVVDMSGRLSFGDPVRLLDKTVSLLVEEGTLKLVLNLDDVSYIDSAGLEALIAIHMSLRDRNGQVKLLNPTKKVKELLELTRLSTVFDTFDDETKAIQASVGAAGKR